MDETLKSIISAASKFIDEISRAAGVKRSVSLFDIGQYAQEQLNAQAPQPAAPVEQPDEYNVDYQTNFVLDVRADENGISVIATKSDGKMYKAPVTVGGDNSITIGEYSEVQIEYTPTAREITVKRQADGRVRWFALPACTAALNRSGEIDSSKLFADFDEYINRTKEYPFLDFFHLGEDLVLGRADWVDADGFAYCASGLFDDTPIGRAAANALEKAPGYWGTSIAYVPTQEPETIRAADGESVKVYHAGINRFISLLPENTAASIMTSISTEGVTRMNKTKKEALKALVGDDQALLDEIEQRIDGVNRSIEDANMIRRDGGSAAEGASASASTPAAPAAEPVPAAPELRAMTPDDMAMILNSAEFENKVAEIVKKLQGATDQPPMQSDAVTPAPVAEDAKFIAAVEALTAQFETLRASVADLAKEPEQIARELMEDMPARFNRPQNIIRARKVLAPADLNNKKVTPSEVANRALEKIQAQKAAAAQQ